MKKKNLFAIFLLLLFALSLPAQAKPQGSIYVDASSNIDLQPDVVEFNVIVTTKDKHSLGLRRRHLLNYYLLCVLWYTYIAIFLILG